MYSSHCKGFFNEELLAAKRKVLTDSISGKMLLGKRFVLLGLFESGRIRWNRRE